MNIYRPYTIFPLGDAALTIDFGNIINESINKKVLELFQHFKKNPVPYTIDIIPAYSSLTVYYDAAPLYQKKEKNKTAFETMAEIIESLAANEQEVISENKKIIEVPVCYAHAFAPDMEYMEREKNLAAEEIIQIHTSKTYRVYMIGFLPGFAYMGEVEEQIAISRKPQPINVAAGAVGIAGKQTGIYPLSSPGGWQIIGQTPLQLFNKEDADPVLFNPGNEVKFYSITEDEFAHYKSRHI